LAIPRPPISKQTEIEVFRRDRWLCHSCLRPVIFPPAMKFLEQFVKVKGVAAPLAYYHPNWRRDAAPLLDELGACVDHVEAHAKGGSSHIANLATICARCNGRKSTFSVQEHLQRYPQKKIKAKHGEPTAWDGLSSLFLVLVDENPKVATATERQWAAALKQARG